MRDQTAVVSSAAASLAALSASAAPRAAVLGCSMLSSFMQSAGARGRAYELNTNDASTEHASSRRRTGLARSEQGSIGDAHTGEDGAAHAIYLLN